MEQRKGGSREDEDKDNRCKHKAKGPAYEIREHPDTTNKLKREHCATVDANASREEKRVGTSRSDHPENILLVGAATYQIREPPSSRDGLKKEDRASQ
ncbi:MAG: hypothetical protein M1812_000239 [Candelaria pacifica]|nr:MAG: hypothetical protein M1812_000239 [Candelaria pacifica]